MRRDVAALLPRDRRPLRTLDDTLTRPDPFEDIPAPRLLRRGAAPAPAKPRFLTSVGGEPGPDAPSARARVSGPGPSAMTVLRLPRAEPAEAPPASADAPTAARRPSALGQRADPDRRVLRGAPAEPDEAAAPIRARPASRAPCGPLEEKPPR